MVYSVYITETFEKEISNLSNFHKRILQKMYNQLRENPYVGDSIRYKFFREKRLKEKRIYYLIYEKLKLVLIIAYSGKKNQQEIIDKIIELLPEYRIYAERLFKQPS